VVVDLLDGIGTRCPVREGEVPKLVSTVPGVERDWSAAFET
jgi:hypothetical protein